MPRAPLTFGALSKEFLRLLIDGFERLRVEAVYVGSFQRLGARKGDTVVLGGRDPIWDPDSFDIWSTVSATQTHVTLKHQIYAGVQCDPLALEDSISLFSCQYLQATAQMLAGWVFLELHGGALVTADLPVVGLGPYHRVFDMGHGLAIRCCLEYDVLQHLVHFRADMLFGIADPKVQPQQQWQYTPYPEEEMIALLLEAKQQLIQQRELVGNCTP